MIIDIHTHAFPDEIAPRAIEALSKCSGVAPNTDGTLAGLSDSMRRAGISKSIVAPIATKPAQVASINRWAAESNRKQEVFRDLSEAEIPKHRADVICLGTLHPEQDDWGPDIEQLVADGIPGVKCHPDYQLFFVDDPNVTGMYRAVADAGLFVLFHAGVDIGLPPPVHCTPDRLARVMDAVPDLTIIAAHMGGYKCWDDVERYLAGRNLLFDTCYTIADLGADRMTALIKAHGVDRVLFGTDSPWTDQAAEVANIRALPLAPAEIDAVLGGNAVRLLGP
jgi:predicted TIM-barrel fold metal-dependent hydrolase